MKNNFITKIIGATLAFAMMIGGAVGINTAKQAKEVNADDVTYRLTIDASDFNTTSYAANNNEKHKDAVCTSDASKKMTVYWTSNQVMKNGDNMQWQKSKGYIYNSTNLGTITSVEVTSSAGSFTTYYGTTAQPSSGSAGAGKGFFKTSVGGATGTSSQVQITFTIAEGAATALANPNPQYNDSTKQVSWTTDAHASGYQVKVDSGTYEDINTETYDASVLTTGVQHTVYIKAVGDGENYTSTEGSVTFTPTAPFIGKEYALCTSVNDLEAGANYIFTNGTTGSVRAMSTESNNNNRKSTGVSVDSTTHRITSTQDTLVVELGGSEDHWTFETTNYSGTDGFFAATGSGNNYYLKVQETAGEATIEFSNNAAVVNIGPSQANTLLRYNSANNGLFSCYGSGQSPVYLWKEFKELDHLDVTGELEKTSYYDSETFDSTGLTVSAVYTDSSSKVLAANDVDWEPLVANMTQIRGSYTELGITKYTEYFSITVAADSLSTVALSGSMGTTYFTTDSWSNGSLVVTATYASGRNNVVTDSATIAFFSDSAMQNAVATPGDLGPGADQTVYVKATYEGVSNATGYAQTVTITIEHGSVENDPLTVAQAVELGSALANRTETSKQYYIQGTVSKIENNQLGEEGNYVFFWLQNGETIEGFEVYNITPAAGCANYNDMKVGAEVLIKCKIKNYDSIIETGSAKSLLSITYVTPTLTGISLNKTSLNLAVAEEDDLTVTPTPLGAELGDISWVSSNSNIATVNSEGHVVAVANGTATITASAGGFEATCSVTVSSKVVMKYSGSTTINMTANDNAELVNLDDELFTVDASKGSGNNFPGLNKDGEIRLYAGGSFVLVTIAPQYTISTIEIDFVSGNSYVDVYVGSTEINANLDGSFSINSQSFKLLGNGGTSKISQVDILYRDATATEKVSRLETRNTLSFSDYHAGENNTFTYDNLAIRFGGLINKDLWDALDTNEHLIQGYGVMISYEDLGGETFESYYNQSKAGKTVEETSNFLFDNDGAGEEDDGLIFGKDYYFPLSNEKTHPAEASASQKAGQPEGTYYIWNLYKNVSNANIEKEYTAVAYIRVGNELVFLTQTTASTRSLAHDLIESGAYASDAFGGSLAYLAGL